MKKRILSLLLSLIMVLSLLPTTAWAAWGGGPGGPDGGGSSGTTTNTVGHIDLAISFKIPGTNNDFRLQRNEVENNKVTITDNSGNRYSYTVDEDTSTDSNGNSQYRLNGSFPVGTKDAPVSYTLTLDVVCNGVNYTLTVTTNYWHTDNKCPGLDHNKQDWQNGAVTSNSGIDVAFGTASAPEKQVNVTKTVRGVDTADLAADKKFTITFSQNGTVKKTVDLEMDQGAASKTVITTLPVGTYDVVETSYDSYADYTFKSTTYSSQTLTVDTNGGSVTVTNTYAKKVTAGNLTITKVNEGATPTSVTFTVTGTNYNNAVTLPTTDGKWTTTLENLPLGTYTVTESGADITGYNLTTTYGGDANTSGSVTIGGEAAAASIQTYGLDDYIFNCGCNCGDCGCKHWIWDCECDDDPCCANCKCSSGSTGQPEQPEQPEQPSTPTTPSATVTVTNTYTQKTTNITVEKKWKNVDGITLPSSIQVQLYNGITKVGDPVTLNAANGWKYTFENLPEYDGSTKINYTAKEVDVPTGFTSSENGLVITNTATRGDDINTSTSLTITKVDKDNASKKLVGAKFTLVSTNPAYSQTATTDSNGVATFTDLTAGTYTLTEIKAPAGYDLDSTSKTIVVVKDSGTTALGTDNVYHTTYKHSVQDNATIGLSNGAMTIQNTRSTENITVTKAWVHGNVPTAQQPTSVTVELMKNGNVKAGQAILNAANQWTHTFTGMPTHDDNGTPINYTVVEDAVHGYTGAVTGSAATGFTITNTAQWTDEKDNTAALTITKVDSEDNTKLTGAVFTLTLGNKTLNSRDNNDGTYTISGIDAAGNWTLTETKAPTGYEATTKTRTVAVEKSSEVKLVDVTVGETTVKKFQTENTYTITDNATIGLSGGAITVTNNKLVDEPITVPATVTVTKYNDDKTEKLKGAEFTLYNDEDEVVGTATTGNDGICKFENLTTGTYTLRETKAPTGYTKVDKTVEITVTESSTTEINASGKFQTTTTYTANPATAEFVNNKILISVDVTKAWEDTDAESYRPKSVTVQLYKNNEAVTGKTLELTAANSWKGSFTDLAQYDGDTENVYTVKEVKPSDSYTATEGTADTGYTITNTANWSDEDAITGATLTIKKVDSADTTKLLSGAKFTLTDKENLSNPMEATTDANGVASFTNLQPGTYMLEEVSAPDGYKENSQVWTVVVTQKQMHDSVTKLDDGTFQKVYSCTVTVSKDMGDEAVLMTPDNNGSYTITNELAPTEYTAKVDIEKIVKKTGGNVAPGAADFTFVANCDGVDKPVGTLVIKTNGADTYTGEMTLTVPASAFKLDKDGNGEVTLYVSEVKGSSAGWTYDDAVYTLVMTVKNYEVESIGFPVEFTPSIFSAQIPDGQGSDSASDTVTLSFTNEFSQTKTPDRPHKPSKPITSVKTGDAGVAMYAMSGLLSLGGAALFMKKRKDEE